MATEKRLIDANECYELADHCYSSFYHHVADLPILRNLLNNCPTVDAVEVVHGRWEYYSTTMMECSNCKRHTARHRFKYCPHCGAVMEDKYNDG